MTPDGVLISTLLTANIGLLSLIYRGMVKRVENFERNLGHVKADFHNFTRCMFLLLSRLNPASAALIAESMTDYYTRRSSKSNGESKGAGA